MDPVIVSQLRALAWLKYKMLRNQWQEHSPLYKFALYGALALVAIFSLSLGLAGSQLVQLVLGNPVFQAEPLLLKSVFLAVLAAASLIWLFFPMLLIMQSEGLQVKKLFLYPIGKHQLYTLHVLTGFLDPWSLFLYPFFIGLVVGGVLALGFWTLAWLLILFGLFIALNIIWGRLLLDLVYTLFASRPMRELFILGMLALTLALVFVPVFWTESSSNLSQPAMELRTLLPRFFSEQSHWLNILLTLTPPGMAAEALSALALGQTGAYAQHTLSLFLFLMLGNRLGSLLLEQFFQAATTEQESRYVFKAERFMAWRFLPQPVLAIVYKELCYLRRSIIGKLIFFLTPALLVLFRFIFQEYKGERLGITLLTGMTGYIFITSLFLFANIFGWDNQGFKNFILTPVRPVHVLLGKNLAFAVFVLLEFALVLYLYLLFFAFPDWGELLFGLLVFLTYLFGALALGNMISIRFPCYVDLTHTRYKQKSLPVLLTFSMFSIIMLFPVGAVLIAYLNQEPLWFIAAGFALVTAGAYWLLFPLSTALLDKEKLFILNKVTRPDT